MQEVVALWEGKTPQSLSNRVDQRMKIVGLKFPTLQEDRTHTERHTTCPKSILKIENKIFMKRPKL